MEQQKETAEAAADEQHDKNQQEHATLSDMQQNQPKYRIEELSCTATLHCYEDLESALAESKARIQHSLPPNDIL